MKVFRTNKKTEGDFTQMANSVIHDKRLSLKARGLMGVLLSFPPNWDLNLKGLVTTVGQNGRDSVHAAFRELKQYGYVVLSKRQHDAQGKFLPLEYEVYEDPDPGYSPQTGFPDTAEPDTGEPGTGNPPLCNTLSINTVMINTEENRIERAVQSNSTILKKDTGLVNALSVSATDQVNGFPLSDYSSRVDLAMAQNLDLARGRYWQQLDVSVTQNRSFKDVFGQQPKIAWTTAEYGYLQEIAQFVAEKWPGQDPLAVTEKIIREAFRKTGKAHQFLKYWFKHSQAKVTLRPFLTLAGGGQDSAKRLDILKELAVGLDISLASAVVGASAKTLDAVRTIDP